MGALNTEVEVPSLAPGEQRTIALEVGLIAPPDDIRPVGYSPVAALASTKSSVTFRNIGAAPSDVIYFYCRVTHSQQRQTNDPPYFWPGGDLPSPPASEAITASLVNGDSVPLVIGQPVAVTAPGTIQRATAASTARTLAVGLVLTGAAPTLPVLTLLSGVLVATTEEWDAVTGQVGGLSAGAVYYLDVPLGGLTTTPPTIPGLSVAPIGRALDTVRFCVLIQTPILL